ncbi:aldehyde reductase [Parvibaculum sp.]|uniref:SDR family oxidoreductase n=1 Tax=Parvibaculum sp. TaxID=2024848 RepID=UPI001DA81C71|nr:aldehyde reductase [Parvibaculum sp.]MBX3489954.1 aldehyde reductase [Parvibaculum sp.]MCW5726058.1 aldehyde reductase [Parvibaculum sp.]
MPTVLVTGGSGFIAAHCILQLLAAGHEVRTTVRNLAREADVRAMLKAGGAEPGPRLSFFAADLTSDKGWAEAAQGADYALHVASPFPSGVPKDENELIVPARDGALRVLRAARDAGVKRVVMTSSFAAIGYGHPARKKPFDETDWTNLEGGGDLTPYTKSKTIAERAAWDFIAREGNGLELATVNPVGVLGPVLGPDFSTSIQIVKGLIDGSVPGMPKLSFGLVDVRDVADLHLRAMTDPAAKGERFLAISGDYVWMRDIARALKARMGKAAAKVPTRQLPNWLVFIAAMRMPELKLVLPELGKEKHATGEKATRLLGWNPRPWEQSAVDTAESLIALDA